MRSDAGHSVFQVDDTGNVIVWARGDGQELVVVANFSNTNYSAYNINFPMGGTWYELLNSQAADYDGNGWGNGGSVVAGGGSNTASVVVPQMGLLVFRHEDPPGRSADLEGGDGAVDLRDYAAFQREFGRAGCGLAADFDEDGRVTLADFTIMEAEFTGPI